MDAPEVAFLSHLEMRLPERMVEPRTAKAQDIHPDGHVPWGNLPLHLEPRNHLTSDRNYSPFFNKGLIAPATAKGGECPDDDPQARYPSWNAPLRLAIWLATASIWFLVPSSRCWRIDSSINI